MKHKMITVELIKSFNPCENRFQNFVNKAPEFKGSLADLASLEHVSYDDFIWVAHRVCTKNEFVSWALATANSVSHLVPESCKASNKELLNYLNSISDFDNLSERQLARIAKLRKAAAAYASAYAAANAADAAAAANAANAANAAYAAAANAAYAAAAAAYAANANANAAYAAYDAAANAANAAYAARQTQKELNILLLLACLEEA